MVLLGRHSTIIIPNKKKKKLFTRATVKWFWKMKSLYDVHCVLVDYIVAWNVRSMVCSLDGIKNQLTTKYLRSVFIIMLFICAINPFLVICQYAEKCSTYYFIFFLVCFCSWFPSICGGHQTKRYRNTKIVRKSSILMQIISHNTQAISTATWPHNLWFVFLKRNHVYYILMYEGRVSHQCAGK